MDAKTNYPDIKIKVQPHTLAIAKVSMNAMRYERATIHVQLNGFKVKNEFFYYKGALLTTDIKISIMH